MHCMSFNIPVLIVTLCSRIQVLDLTLFSRILACLQSSAFLIPFSLPPFTSVTNSIFPDTHCILSAQSLHNPLSPSLYHYLTPYLAGVECTQSSVTQYHPSVYISLYAAAQSAVHLIMLCKPPSLQCRASNSMDPIFSSTKGAELKTLSCIILNSCFSFGTHASLLPRQSLFKQLQHSNHWLNNDVTYILQQLFINH